MTKPVSRLTVQDLVAALAGPGLELPQEVLPQVTLGSAVIDSRLATPGCLFIALHGEHHDGHDFVPQAVEKGAVAIIAEVAPDAGVGCAVLNLTVGQLDLGITSWKPPLCLIVPDSLAALQQAAAYWRRHHDVRVVGITGSIGKTTSKETVAAVLEQRYRTLKSQGNYNNEIGLPLTLLHLTSEHERVVLEMGMYDLGEITQLAGIALPQVGVVTNVGPTHLERLGTVERIAQAKAELPQALPSSEEGGVAILNADDEHVRAMSKKTRARVFTYGLHPKADVWASDVDSEGLEGIHFRLHFQEQGLHVQVPMLGCHSVHTALCGAAVGLVEGLDLAEIVAGLRDQPVQLRLVAVPGPSGSIILDDTYNASPASCIAALNLLDELGTRRRAARKIAVLGDMYELGAYEQEGHRLVGRRARDAADLLVTVGRLGQIIGQAAMYAGMAADTVHLAETKEEAIDLLRNLLGTGDLILIKGSRGLAMEEMVIALQEGELS
jgi:UDP-N-acetylmuramoyl-tripeptide--D-alanyl-D-alanine ligase